MAATNKIRKQITMSMVDVGQALQSLHIIGTVITADISTGWVEVGENNVLRVVLAANTYFSFSNDNTAPAVNSTTSPAVMLLAGENYLITSAKYVRASANPTRTELLDA